MAHGQLTIERERTGRFLTLGIRFFLAAALTAVGLLRQEHLEVMGKAVRICLECIGIG